VQAVESFALCVKVGSVVLPSHAAVVLSTLRCQWLIHQQIVLCGPHDATATERWLPAQEWGWVRRKSLPRRIDVVLFSAATAAILHCYSDAHGVHRDVFRSKCASRKPCGKLKFLVNLTSLVALPSAVCNAPVSCWPLS